jgi:hypothetical protein
MENKLLPGYEFAKEKGYSLYAVGGSGKMAIYTKRMLSLTCLEGNIASLAAYYRAIKIGIDKFSYPNANFETFEHQIMKCIPQEAKDGK